MTSARKEFSLHRGLRRWLEYRTMGFERPPGVDKAKWSVKYLFAKDMHHGHWLPDEPWRNLKRTLWCIWYYRQRILSGYFWNICWIPKWHKGRGPYISIGLGLFAIYRGY